MHLTSTYTNINFDSLVPVTETIELFQSQIISRWIFSFFFIDESQKSMLYIKGQMIYVKEWSMLLFIGKPK